MLIYFQSVPYDVLSLWWFVAVGTVYITNATASVSFINDHNHNNFGRQAEEFVMTSAMIDGIKRSNVCGDGYRIEGVLLKSYPYSEHETYLPYEDCSMTFQARRASSQIRIRILTLDINDIHGGTNCFDSLRFYKSVYVRHKDRLDSVECGQLTEAENFSFISPTGIVTAHFSTDGGNVSGLGFKVVLTAFRYPNETHQCDPDDDEYLCTNGECISSLLLCDGVAHCLDGSDEMPNHSCLSNAGEPFVRKNPESNNHRTITKYPHWRGILILGFFLLIFVVFVLFVIYFLCRCCLHSSKSSINIENNTYSTIVHSPLNESQTSPTTTRLIGQSNQSSKHRDDDDDDDDDYDLL